MNKKIILFWSLSVFLAFSLGRLDSTFKITSEVITDEEVDKEIENISDVLTQKLEKLTSSELSEYKQLKTQEEKYNKAKEIYEKVFQMLLATLGTKLEISQFKIPEYKNVKKEIIQKSPMVQTSSIGSHPDKTQVFPNSEKNNEPQLEREDYSNPSENFENLIEQRKYKNSVNIKNANKFRSNTNTIEKRSKLLEKFMGSYSGKILLFKKYQKENENFWEIRIDANFQYKGRKNGYKGDAYIEMSSASNGPFSRSRNGGQNDSFLYNKNYRNYLVIKASPSVFIALKYSSAKETWEGDVFKLNGKTTKYEQIGVIPVLYRN